MGSDRVVMNSAVKKPRGAGGRQRCDVAAHASNMKVLEVSVTIFVGGMDVMFSCYHRSSAY